MNLTIGFLRQYYRLNNIVRYNTWHKNNLENVAAHSYFTIFFSMVLCEKFQLTVGETLNCMKIATLHDSAEVITNDITYDAKCKMPLIKPILDEYEAVFVKENFPLDSGLVLNKSQYNLEHMVVSIADVLSVIQYCDNEVQLGNKRFVRLLHDAINRLITLNKKLEHDYNYSIGDNIQSLFLDIDS